MDSQDIRDVFQNVGELQIRRMFGGHGVYRDGLMFALESGGELYLKVDPESVDLFRDLGSRPFVYEAAGGRQTTMSYWLLPAAAFDEPDEAARLAQLALAAASRAQARKPVKGVRSVSSRGKAKKPAARRPSA